MRKKNIAIVTLAVALEGEKGYSRFRFLSDMLSEYYHVDLITSTFQHWEKKQRDIKDNQNSNNSYRVIFAYEPGYKRNVDIRRVYSHRIAVKNIKKILSKYSYDLIYCIIPDNQMAAEVGAYAKRNGIKYIVDVEDLWPEAMEMISPLPKRINRALFDSYRKSAQKAYNCADAFVGTSDEYRDIPQKKYGICNKPAITVYVGCDLDESDAGVREFSNEVVKENGEFWVTYAGNLGSSYDLITLIKTAQSLYEEGYNHIVIKILGDGPLKSEFEKISEQKPCRVEFLGYMNYRKMAAFLDRSDILVNSFVKKAPQSIVTKIGDYLAAGKPIINTLNSIEFRKKVEADGFGVNVEPENEDSLLKAIKFIRENKRSSRKMGKNARMVAEKEFDRKKSYIKIKELIEKCFAD